jgi:hypothetical protein
MAEEDSWDSIREKGLWSTSGLLDLFEIDGEPRQEIEQQNRRESVEITHPVHGTVVIRDQKPMSDGALEKCLQDGLSPQDWYQILNRKVFFWATHGRLLKLLNGRAYRDKTHDVLTVDTERLLAVHADQITLCPYNSGSTIFKPVVRGENTFLSIADHPFEHWKKKRGRDAVVEVAVDTGVPDLNNIVIKVEKMHGSKVIDEIYKN